VWSNLVYGYDLLHYKYVHEGTTIIDLYAAPQIALALFDLDVRLRRTSPVPGSPIGGHASSLGIGLGGRIGVDLFEHVPLGFEITELPGPVGVSSPRLRLWERIRAFAGVRFWNVEAEVGYRLQASHIQGDARGADMRFTGVDFSLGVRF
jgi:hypothetical protein